MKKNGKQMILKIVNQSPEGRGSTTRGFRDPSPPLRSRFFAGRVGILVLGRRFVCSPGGLFFEARGRGYEPLGSRWLVC
jgi:hypothetical protein